jgi:predicted Zn-dependent protease
MLPEFLSTHPVTTNRIAEAQERAAQYRTGRSRDSLDYHLTRYKLRVLESQNKKALVGELQDQLDKGHYQNATAHTYGLALAMLEAGDPGSARNLIHKLRQQDRERIAFIILDARAQADNGQYTKARQTFEQALKIYPHNHPLTMHYTRLLLANNQAELAYQVLGEHSRRNVNDPETFKILAQAAGDSGHKAEAHISMAEYYYLNGHLNGAIQQLNLARGFVANNYYLGERVEARMREFEQELADSQPLP